MISKTKRLKNIGKFYDFSAQANELDWDKNTFVLAPNAYGKTTLVNVLRSLRDDDPSLLRARKTLGVATNPEAVIVMAGQNYVFDGTRWDRSCPDIFIFDAPYIHRNILAQEIGHEHKKNIHRIIIGAQGIKLAEELAKLKTKEKAKSQEVTNLAKQFSRSGFGFSLDKFLTIPPEEEAAVGARIEKLERDIKSKESEAAIRAFELPKQVTVPCYDLSAARTLAAGRLAAIHETAQEHVLAHIARNFKDTTRARQFIREGLELMQADCPFCGQDLKNASALLKVYGEFFNEAFRTYQQGIAEAIVSIDKWNLDNDLTSLVSTHNANLAAARQWEPHIGEVGLPDIAAAVDECRAELAASRGKVRSELERKQKDPNADADTSQFDALAAGLVTLKLAVEEYNKAASVFAEKAKQHVVNLPTSDVASLRSALAKEQDVRKRFTPGIMGTLPILRILGEETVTQYETRPGFGLTVNEIAIVEGRSECACETTVAVKMTDMLGEEPLVVGKVGEPWSCHAT